MPPRMSFLDVLYGFTGIFGFLFYTVLMLAFGLRVVMTRRPIGVSLAWLALIFGIPVLGISLYVLFGEVRLGRKRAARAIDMYQPYASWIRQLVAQFPLPPAHISDKAAPLSQLIAARLGMPMLHGNQLSLLTEPEAILQALAEDIRVSSVSCYLEFYIWQPGGTVDEVAQALLDAAMRGVDCRVLLDSVGSKDFFKTEWPARFRTGGVRLVEVLPAGAWRIPFHRQDLRMHRKLVVIDDRVAYTGSMNLVDPRYFKQEAGVGQWIDIMLRLRGPIVPLIWSLFVRDWEMETGERLLESQEHSPEYWDSEDHRLQLAPSGPFTGGDCIQQVLLQAIYQARDKLVLTTPYFVPDDPLAAALSAAADRGVQVQLILPARNDSIMVNFACNSFLESLLHSGVEIYRFHSGLLHTKSVLVDEEVALVGTVNLDRRSLWLNFEASVLVDSPAFCRQLARLQQAYIAQASQMNLQEWQARPWHQKLRENIFFLVSPLL